MELKKVDELGEIGLEYLAELVHIAYCTYYLESKGEPYWTKGDYSKLDEATKEIDRVTVKTILNAVGIKVK